MKNTIICAVCFCVALVLSVLNSAFMKTENIAQSQVSYNFSQSDALNNNDQNANENLEDTEINKNPQLNDELFLNFNNKCNIMFSKLFLFGSCLYLEIFQQNYIFRKNLATNKNSNNLTTAINEIENLNSILTALAETNNNLNQNTILNSDACINSMNRVYQILNIICELDKKISDGTLNDYLTN